MKIAHMLRHLETHNYHDEVFVVRPNTFYSVSSLFRICSSLKRLDILILDWFVVIQVKY